MPSLIDRLKRRKLAQWGFAYLAGAWLLLEISDVVGDKFGWPDALYRDLIVLLVSTADHRLMTESLGLVRIGGDATSTRSHRLLRPSGLPKKQQVILRRESCFEDRAQYRLSLSCDS